MSHQGAASRVQDDLADTQSWEVLASHQKDVARPDRGQHAAARDLQSYFAEGTGYFRHELALQRDALLYCGHSWALKSSFYYFYKIVV
jgi:hypothetical protein